MKKLTAFLLTMYLFFIAIGYSDAMETTQAKYVRDYSNLRHITLMIGLVLVSVVIWGIKEKRINIILRESEEKYKLLFENAVEAIMVLQDGKFKIFDPIAEKILKSDANRLKTVDFMEIVYSEDKERISKLHLDRLSGKESGTKHTFRIVGEKGEIVWVESKGIKIAWNNRPASLNFITDITDRKKKEEDILYLSFHDQLTGAYNRRFFEEELQRLDNLRNLPLTIVMIDVNGLKIFNDLLGHKSGDELIQKVANVVIKESRKNDVFARMGGDEFTLLMPNTGTDEARAFIKRVNEEFKKQKVDSLDISVSLGYETKIREEQNIEDIIKKADENMYKNKANQSNEYRDTMVEKIYDMLSNEVTWEKEHSEKIRRILGLFANELEFDEERVEKLQVAGYYHDIGKYFVDRNLLNKEEPLTEEEFSEYKKHSEAGYQILKSSKKYMPIAEIILRHHENWDGSGYPDGLKELKIPLESRILAIAEAYEELVTEKPYQKAISKEEAIEKIKEESGTRFDSDLVKLFIEDVVKQI